MSDPDPGYIAPKPPPPPEPTWEILFASKFDFIERIQCQGGWIIRNRMVIQTSTDNPQAYNWALGLVYVPDTATPGSLPATE